MNIRVLSLLIILTVFLSAGPSASQVVNVERYRTADDTLTSLAGALGAGLTISKNITRIVRLTNSADLTYNTRFHEFLIVGRNSLLRVEGENVLNDGYLHLRSVFYRHNALAPEFFLQAQYNQDWGMKRRGLAGAAVRIRFTQTKNFRAFASTGLMLENELWVDEQKGLRTERTLVKSTTSINLRGRVTESMEVAAITYYQARPVNIHKPRFTSDVQLRFRISENLRFVFQFVSTYDSDPPFRSTDFIYHINHLLEVRF